MIFKEIPELELHDSQSRNGDKQNTDLANCPCIPELISYLGMKATNLKK